MVSPQLDITCWAYSSTCHELDRIGVSPDIPLSVSLFPVSWGVDPRWEQKEETSHISYMCLKMFQSPSKRNLYASIVYIHVLIWNKRLCMKWVFSIGLFRLYPVLHIYVHLYICQKRCHVARCFFINKTSSDIFKMWMNWRRNNRCSDVGGHFQALDEVPLIRLNDMTLKSPWNNMPKQVDLYVFLMKRRVWHATACCIGTDTKSRT